MHKFYWNNTQRTRGGAAASHQPQQQSSGSTCSAAAANPNIADSRQQISTSQSSVDFATMNNPQIPARNGATTIRVVESEPSDLVHHHHHHQQQQQKPQKTQNTPSGSHRVLLKLRRMSAANNNSSQQNRPKSLHGMDQVLLDNLTQPNSSSSGSHGKRSLPNSKSMHQFYNRTWNERSLQKYAGQHNYENVYSNEYETASSEVDPPIYENVLYRSMYANNSSAAGASSSASNNQTIVINQLTCSPRSARSSRDTQNYLDNGHPPQPERHVPPVPPERKGRGRKRQQQQQHQQSHEQKPPLFRSKSCERPKMRDAMRDTFRISSERIQLNFNRFSSNLTDKLTNNVMNKLSSTGNSQQQQTQQTQQQQKLHHQTSQSSQNFAATSVSSSSRISSMSIDSGSCKQSTTSSGDDSSTPPNSLLQSVALKAIPCVDIQSHGTSSLSGGSEDGMSQAPISDFDDNEEHARPPTSASSASSSRPSLALAHKMRGLRKDVQEKFSRLRSRSAERISKRSLVSGRSSPERRSQRSTSICGDDDDDIYDLDEIHFKAEAAQTSTPSSCSSRQPPPFRMTKSYSGLPQPTEVYNGPFIGRARALVNYIPSPYDRDALRFNRGDTIDIISMNPSGLWRGKSQGRVGHFKFINVELLPDRQSRSQRRHERLSNRDTVTMLPTVASQGPPKSVEDLLKRIGLEEHLSVFVLNGYEELENFQDMDESELDYLGITDVQQRAKIMTAVEMLQDNTSTLSTNSDDDPDTETQGQSCQVKQAPKATPEPSNCTSPMMHFERGTFPRDSGCFASSSSNEHLPRSSPASDRSSQQSQSESGIHLPHDDDDSEEVEYTMATPTQKRPAEQSAKMRSLRDRHTLTAKDIENMTLEGDKKYEVLCEKYSTKQEKALLEGKFNSARSVFEQPTTTPVQRKMT